MAEGVDTVLATKAVTIPTAPGSVLTEPVAVSLGGDFSGVGCEIPVGAVIGLPTDASKRRKCGDVGSSECDSVEISVSVISPSSKMLTAAKSQGFELSSCVVYYGESGLKFDPWVKMKLQFSEQALDELVTLKFRSAIVRWNVKDSTWEEISWQGIPDAELDGTILSGKNWRFSAYSAVTLPVDVSLPTSGQNPGGIIGGATSAPPSVQDTEEAPITYPTIIAVSVVGAVCVLVLTAFGFWYVKRQKGPQGLPSYLLPPQPLHAPLVSGPMPSVGGVADFTGGYAQDSGARAAAIEATLSGFQMRQHDLDRPTPLVNMPMPMSSAPQTQPSIQQLGGLNTPMSSMTMSVPEAGTQQQQQRDHDTAAGVVGAQVYQKYAQGMPQQEDEVLQGRQPAVPRPITSAFSTSPASTPAPPVSASVQSNSRKQSDTQAGPDGSSTRASPPASVTSAIASSKRTGLDQDGQSQRSARSRQSQSRHSDSPLGDLDYDSADNESSWGGSQSSDGESEGPVLTQADLTALLAGVAAAERLSSIYLEPDSANVFAGFDQFSAGETPYTPASDDTSPRSGRSRRSRARSAQGVPVSTSAAIQAIEERSAPADEAGAATATLAVAPKSLPRLVPKPSLESHPLFTKPRDEAAARASAPAVLIDHHSTAAFKDSTSPSFTSHDDAPAARRMPVPESPQTLSGAQWAKETRPLTTAQHVSTGQDGSDTVEAAEAATRARRALILANIRTEHAQQQQTQQQQRSHEGHEEEQGLTLYDVGLHLGDLGDQGQDSESERGTPSRRQSPRSEGLQLGDLGLDLADLNATNADDDSELVQEALRAIDAGTADVITPR